MTATRGTRPSWAWTSLLKGRELLQRGTRWQIHNGQSVNFWEDKWIPSVPCFQISTIKPLRTLIHVVADAIDPTCKCWKMEVLQQFVTLEEIQAISLIPISMENKQDVVEWHPSKFGIFSIKSGMLWLMRYKTSNNRIVLQLPSSSHTIFGNRFGILMYLPSLSIFCGKLATIF